MKKKTRTQLTDHEVAHMRYLREEFNMSYRWLAWIFRTSRSTAQFICTRRRRADEAADRATAKLELQVLEAFAPELPPDPRRDIPTPKKTGIWGDHAVAEVMAMHEEGMSYVFISKTLKIGLQSVMEIIKQNQELME